MAWVVDTCLLLDIALDDPGFAAKSEKLLEISSRDGLLICPVTFVELAPTFGENTQNQEEFLFGLGIDYREDWTWEDTRRSSNMWSRYVLKRRAKQIAKRPVADVLIGAFASRFQGLLTRNAGDFSRLIPRLAILEP